MAAKPYVHSNFERNPDDHYPTIDTRCLDALLDTIPYITKVVDCCARGGSAIVDQLISKGMDASGLSDAFSEFECGWIVTNPPYNRKLVDNILWQQIHNLENDKAFGLAALVRNNFDFAKSRYEMFSHPMYFGQIHMMFRPWWSDEHAHQPIHNYVWHIWTVSASKFTPAVWYWKENHENK